MNPAPPPFVSPIAIGHPRRWAILALVLAAECMDLLDGTIVNVAAPTMRANLHAGASALQWIIGGYALTFAIGLIAGGRLGDRYGRKRLFVIGALGFVATSLASACALGPTMLIVSRLAQGAAAALLIPQGLGIIRAVFGPAEQGKAFAVFGPVIGLSAVLGPIVGGGLIALNAFGTGWRSVFLVNLPLGLVAALGAARLMPESKSARAARLDGVGTLMGAAAMGLLIYPLIQGRQAGWPAWTYLMMAASAACFGLLLMWSRRVRRAGRDALIDPGIFAHRGYAAGLACVVVFFSGMLGTLLVLTLFLQFGEHFTAVHAGITLVPFAVGSALGAGLGAAVVVPRLGRGALQVASTLLAGGFWWLHGTIATHGLATTSVQLIPAQIVLGAGIGMLISTLFNFILASVTDDEVGSGSGVLNATQQLAGAIGVAVIGTVFFSVLAHGGYVKAIDRCLLIELAATPVLAGLTLTLPRRPRPEEAVEERAAAPGAEALAA